MQECEFDSWIIFETKKMHFLLAQVKPVIMWRFIVEIKGLVRKFSNFVSNASFCPLSAFVLRRRKFSVAEL
jgi:hypothetical protein